MWKPFLVSLTKVHSMAEDDKFEIKLYARNDVGNISLTARF